MTSKRLTALATLCLASFATADTELLRDVLPFGGDQPWPIMSPPAFVESPTNRAVRPRVLVLNYAPRIPSEGNRQIWEVFKWHDPRQLAAGFVRDLAHVSGGAVVPRIVQWRDLDEFPPMDGGFRYAPDEYVAMRRVGAKAPWREGKADFHAIAREHGIAQLVNDDVIDEVWLFGDHYFALLGEDWMVGPGAFFINGPTFPTFPVDRAFAGFGFNYERHGAEMLHNLAHRTENHMRRAYGGWDRKSPKTTWDRFTANSGQVGGEGPFGVGNCHYPPNGRRDYDYTNPTVVQSTAVDWLNYPNLTGQTSDVDLSTWAVPGTRRGPVDSGVGRGLEHLQYQRWFFSHIPRADGTTDDGRQNNWFKYIFDFNAYAEQTGLPRMHHAFISAGDETRQGVGANEVRIRFYGPVGLNLETIDARDVEIVAADGTTVTPTRVSRVGEESSTTAGVTRAIRYEWDATLSPGKYTARLKAGAIADREGRKNAEASVAFVVVE